MAHQPVPLRPLLFPHRFLRVVCTRTHTHTHTRTHMPRHTREMAAGERCPRPLPFLPTSSVSPTPSFSPTRAVTFSLLAFVTFILCLLKVRLVDRATALRKGRWRAARKTRPRPLAHHHHRHRHHHDRRPQVVQIQRGLTIERYHLAVFYLATIETLILFLHWVYLSEIALHFVALYLHVNQFLLIAVFYGRLAARILRPTPRTNRCASLQRKMRRVQALPPLPSSPLSSWLTALSVWRRHVVPSQVVQLRGGAYISVLYGRAHLCALGRRRQCGRVSPCVATADAHCLALTVPLPLPPLTTFSSPPFPPSPS